jgi:hypothetical protein
VEKEERWKQKTGRNGRMTSNNVAHGSSAAEKRRTASRCPSVTIGLPFGASSDSSSSSSSTSSSSSSSSSAASASASVAFPILPLFLNLCNP